MAFSTGRSASSLNLFNSRWEIFYVGEFVAVIISRNSLPGLWIFGRSFIFDSTRMGIWSLIGSSIMWWHSFSTFMNRVLNIQYISCENLLIVFIDNIRISFYHATKDPAGSMTNQFCFLSRLSGHLALVVLTYWSFLTSATFSEMQKGQKRANIFCSLE